MANGRETWEGIIERGEKALARWSANNPMRSLIERNVAEARAKLAEASE